MGDIKKRGGRPTKYNTELQQQAEDYLYNWSERDNLPSRVGLCSWLGIAKSTSYEWGEIHPEFSNTLKAVDTLQEYVAVNKGITGEFNSTIVKLILANHGYSDRQNLDHTTNGKDLAAPAFGSLYGTKEEDA